MNTREAEFIKSQITRLEETRESSKLALDMAQKLDEQFHETLNDEKTFDHDCSQAILGFIYDQMLEPVVNRTPPILYPAMPDVVQDEYMEMIEVKARAHLVAGLLRTLIRAQHKDDENRNYMPSGSELTKGIVEIVQTLHDYIHESDRDKEISMTIKQRVLYSVVGPDGLNAVDNIDEFLSSYHEAHPEDIHNA